MKPFADRNEALAFAKAHKPTEILPPSVRPKMRGGVLDEPREAYRARVLAWMRDSRKAWMGR